MNFVVAPIVPARSIAQTGELYDVRWPDGRRFDSRRQVDARQAMVLLDGGICEEVRSPSGILRYLRILRTPSVKRFATLLAQADFTIARTGNLHEHISSRRKGL
jgi:hypothetical protein